MTISSFDIKCYSELYDRFHLLFEKELINEICQSAELRKVTEYTELISIGDKITHMPLIVSGSLKVMTENENGEELLLYYLELGETCAMTLKCCSNSSKSGITASTVENSEILFIPVANMNKWMEKYQSWRDFVLNSYHIRMNELLNAVDNLAFNNMEQRLTKYLQERASINQNGMLIITHLQIANDLHSSRVVISRLMKKLEKENIIKQYRNRVELLTFN